MSYAETLSEPIAGVTSAAVLGAGLIGASMAAMFATAGVSVKLWDPRPESEPEFRRRLAIAQDQLEQLGRAPRSEVVWVGSLVEAVSSVQWIQENAPEDVSLKRSLYERVEIAASDNAIIASSTSALTWSELASGLSNPLRFVTAHPFNPAHLMPLIEIYGRSEETIQSAVDFFTALGKQTVTLRLDAIGHIANRLASALWREAVHIVAEGIADVEAVDAALVHGPGLRWSIAGSHMNYHLGGGSGGLARYLEQLGPSQERRWETLGNPKLTDSVCARLIEGINKSANGRTIAELEHLRDCQILETLKLRKSLLLRGVYI